MVEEEKQGNVNILYSFCTESNDTSKETISETLVSQWKNLDQN